MKSVYCSVRNGSLNKVVCASSVKGQLMAQKVILYNFWAILYGPKVTANLCGQTVTVNGKEHD